MALHTKHRPDTWSAMIGQTTVKIVLESEIINGEIAHAYLFCGPRGIGKTTVARLLAKTVNCTGRVSGTSEPCNDCFNCQSFRAGNALDVIEIDAASHTGVDHVREHIIENARFSPHSSKYKVFIIDEVHMLSTAAFNALLKTLEEPPAHIIFILATTEMHKVPTTILSRCQIFQFKKLTTDQIVERLTILAARENTKVEVNVLREVARVSEGSLRDAESLLGQIFAIATLSADGTYKTISEKQANLVIPESYFGSVLEFLQFLQVQNTAAAIRYVNNLRQEGKDLIQFLNNTIEFLRKLLLLKVSPELNEFAVEFDPATEEQVQNLAMGLSTEEILQLINIAIEEKNMAKYAIVESLPLELVVMKFAENNVANVRQINSSQTSSPKQRLIETPVAPTPMPAPAPVATVTQIKPEIIIPPMLNQNVIIDFSKITEKWNMVLEHLEEISPSIPLMLRTAKPLSVENLNVRVGLKYKFHAERLNTIKNRAIINQALNAIYDLPLNIECLHTPELEGPGDQSPLVDNIIQQFGGQII